MLSRRAFLRACMYTAPVALLVPEVARTIILPPVGGWHPATLEEIIKAALRARAGRIAENIARESPLYARLLRNRVHDLPDLVPGHMLDIARSPAAIRALLVRGTMLPVDPSMREGMSAGPDLQAGYERLPWIRTFDVKQPLEPTIPMPEEFRVGGLLREEFPKLPTRRGEFRDHLVSPDRWYELNAGHNG